MRRYLLPLVIAFAAAAGPANAATFYVSPSGSDSNVGTSSAAPWKSVSRVNNAALAPGDVVSFQGGATFSDSTLMPRTSGTSSARITFGSYGTGRATIAHPQGAVWLAPGRNYLTFESLELTTNGGAFNVFGDGDTPGSSYITIRNSVIKNSGATGIGSWRTTDVGWRIENNTITHIGDSGIAILGSGAVVEGNRVSDIGWNSSLSWAKHGIYSKGPDTMIAKNDFSAIPNGQAVSIRFHGAHVYGNTIHDTPYAVGFFDYDTAAAPQGTSYVYGNKIWNLTGWFFYYSGQLDPNGQIPSVSFVVANNSVSLASASDAVNVSETRNAHVTFANNVVTGTYSSAFRKIVGKTSEYNNAWSGGAFNVPTTTSDIFVNPNLAAPSGFAPLSGSPVIDRGSPSVPGLTYSSNCNATVLSFCGIAPDMGAVESANSAPPPPPPPPSPPAGLTAPGIVGTAQVGASLSATAGTWSGSPTSYAYQWRRCDVAGANCLDVAGATTSSFTPAAAHAGATLRVSVSASNTVGTATMVSAQSATVAAAPAAPTAPVNTAAPAISGTPLVGAAGTATTGTWSGNPTSYAYQWLRCDTAGAGCVPLAGATTGSYTPVALDAGKTLRVSVSATNATGTTSVQSPQSPLVAAPAPAAPGPSVGPTVTISSPLNNAVNVPKNVTIHASATSDRAIRELSFLLNGKEMCRLDAASGSCKVRLPSGDNTIIVKATDASGAVGSTSISLRKD